MFVVTEAAAIRAVFEQEGELSDAIEVRRLLPGVTDTGQARGPGHRRVEDAARPALPVTRLTSRQASLVPRNPASSNGAPAPGAGAASLGMRRGSFSRSFGRSSSK